MRQIKPSLCSPIKARWFYCVSVAGECLSRVQRTHRCGSVLFTCNIDSGSLPLARFSACRRRFQRRKPFMLGNSCRCEPLYRQHGNGGHMWSAGVALGSRRVLDRLQCFGRHFGAIIMGQKFGHCRLNWQANENVRHERFLSWPSVQGSRDRRTLSLTSYWNWNDAIITFLI